MHGGFRGMCAFHKISWVLVIVGALNWGIVGAFGGDWNLVMKLLGQWPAAERIVYVLVGVSALMMLAQAKCCGKCEHHEHGHEHGPSSGPAMGTPPKP